MRSFRQTMVAGLVLMMASTVWAADADEVVLNWLDLIDSGKFEESWDQAAPMFQAQLSSAQWSTTIDKARAPLGFVQAREVSSITAHSSLPGAPDGDYQVLQLATRFSNKVNAVETVTVVKVEGEWRPIGYFIK